MKTLLISVAFATAIASPAFAQVRQAYEPAPGQAFAQSWQDSQSPYGAYAQAPYGAYAQYGIRDRRPHLGNPAWHVYNGVGEYVGTDPDPFIRNDLARDPPNRNDD